MANKPQPDWDPQAADVLRDQRTAYDAMRKRCPVAYSESLQWSLFRHEDIVRVLHDPATFSNAVSQHVSAPNGMDPPEHTHYRQIVEPYFAAERIEAFEPTCRQIARNLVRSAVSRGKVEVMADVGLPFAAQIQCAFLGWPPALHEQLIRWTKSNADATRNQDRQALAELAGQFIGIVEEIILARLSDASKAELDVTAALMREKVREQPLGKAELASILRNWTVGEVGTISAAVGIIAHFLAEHRPEAQQLRSEPALLPAAVDEILRIHGPLASNRRITTRPVEIGGRKLEAGARITLMWVAANRDERVFEEPDCYRLDRGSDQNLLFGAGIHACPAAPLARMELRVVTEELLNQTSAMELIPDKPPAYAQYPASGFHTLPLALQGSQEASSA